MNGGLLAPHNIYRPLVGRTTYPEFTSIGGPTRKGSSGDVCHNYPQSFGANAPPTGGYNKSDLLTEVLQ